eukprot:CAMPEP_0114534358 /NCGR_PEP_ID=MMETSP0109-20121206/27794_1 /TAXON_ID=29199 /ORGANISM="Chlorarachnion reptans, Strain CCCM449" /LENGTH=302 /DNA_ID=CAMNT_0001717759 /DNA_START=512 /DNA_END=1420 /DNA_ORIENTATION=-
MVEKIDKCFDDADALQIQLGTGHYNLAIGASIGAKEFLKAKMLLKDMHRKNIKRNQKTYLEYLQGCGKSKDKVKVCLEAENCLRRMIEDGLTPRTKHYDLVLEKCWRAGRLGNLATWFNAMRDRGIRPTRNSWFYFLIASVMRKNDSETVENIFLQMKNDNIEPDIKMQNAILSSLLRKKKYNQTIQWYTERIQGQHDPTPFTRKILLEAYAEKGDAKGMEEIFLKLKKPTHEHFTVVLQGLVVSQDAEIYEKAQSLWSHFMSMGLTPSLVHFNSMIKICERKGLNTEMRFWELQRDESIPL